jgi:TetR/AcrR family transcriptional regulator, transcriptional repressor for nem operon
LADKMGITGASLYNAFGDKRSLFKRLLDRYVGQSFADRVTRFKRLPLRQALQAFFDEIIERPLRDRQHKGCMLVNTALDAAPHDPDFKKAVADVLLRVEGLFRRCIEVQPPGPTKPA